MILVRRILHAADGPRPAHAARVALALLLTAAPLAAHPALDERLVLLDARIAEHPEDATLRLTRGSLLLDEGHPREALTELDRVLALDPALSVARLLRARALLADSRIDDAIHSARSYLEFEPSSSKGWRTLARALVAKHDLVPADETARFAANAFDRAIALSADPIPDDYLERARFERSAGRFEDAVRGLDEGIARLGPLTSLLHAALEIERDRGRFEAALGYAARLAISSPQTERWSLERAKLLRELGRSVEAREALARASESLAERPEARRASPAGRALAEEIEATRIKLDRDRRDERP